MMSLTSLLCACQSDEDKIRARIQTLETVLQYRDAQGLYTHHIDSHGQGALCAPERAAIWARIDQADPSACLEAQAVLKGTPDDQARDEALLLLSEMVSLRCQHPTQSCQELSQHWFVRRAQRGPWWSADLSRLTLTQITQTSAQEAVAYVTLHQDSTPPRALRMTWHLRKNQDQWWLATYPW